MSFRRFIYYSTLIGAWAAFIGWALARILVGSSSYLSGSPNLEMSLYALFLGLSVAFGLSLVDALWNFSPSQFVSVFGRVAVAMVIGMLGSAACGGIGAAIRNGLERLPLGGLLGSLAFLCIWIALGLLVGVSVGVFDLFAGLARKDARGPLRKLLKCAVGGTLGGILGGILASLIRFQVGPLLGDDSGNELWSPTAVGFVTLGGLIGLLVGLSQVFLLEAWVNVEAGFRPGRDLVITRDRTLIGRAEGSDIALFGDNGVEKQHAYILLDGGGYYLEPLPNTPGTYINDRPVLAKTLLHAGDLIRVGKSLLRFNQRRKK
jgi:hypothetical protein